MKKFLIEQSEKEAILKMHGFLKEQAQQQAPQETMSDVDKLKLALQTCIKNYKWFTPDPTSPIRRTKSGKDLIIGTSSNGNTYYFYADLNVVNASTGAKRTWDCDFKPLPATPTSSEPNKDVVSPKTPALGTTNNQLPTVTKAQRITTTAQQCRIALNNLLNNMERPNQYPLSDDEIKNAVAITRNCAEKKRFLGIGGNKLDKVARKYGIEVR